MANILNVYPGEPNRAIKCCSKCGINVGVTFETKTAGLEHLKSIGWISYKEYDFCPNCVAAAKIDRMLEAASLMATMNSLDEETIEPRHKGTRATFNWDID